MLSYHFYLCCLRWLKITDRIEYKLLSLTYKSYTSWLPWNLHFCITSSLQPARRTRSSSVVTALGLQEHWLNIKIKKFVPCETNGRLLEWLSSSHDLDLVSCNMAYRRASVIDLYQHTPFHWNRKKLFVDRLTAATPPSSRSRDTKTRTDIKNLADQI